MLPWHGELGALLGALSWAPRAVDGESSATPRSGGGAYGGRLEAPGSIAGEAVAALPVALLIIRFGLRAALSHFLEAQGTGLTLD